MPYPINRSDGTLLLNVQDYSRDSEATSLTLLGRGSVDYGESVAENFVHMLESFSGPTPPANPLQGQTWFHSFNPGPPIANVAKLKVFNGTEWVPIGGATSSVDPPEGPEAGDLWYNQEDSRIYYWDGFTWKPVGGPYTGVDPGVDPEDLPDDVPLDPPSDPAEGELWWMLPERQLWAYDSSLANLSCFPPNSTRSSDGSTVPNGWVLVGPQGLQDPDDPDGGSYDQITNITIINPETQEEEQVDIKMVVIDGQIVTVWTDQLIELVDNEILGMPFTSWSDPQDPASSTKILRPGLNQNHGAGMVLNGQSSDSERLNGLNGSQFLRSDITTYPLSTDTAYDLGTETNHWRRFYARNHYGADSIPGTDDVSSISFHGKATAAVTADATETAKYLLYPQDLLTDPETNEVHIRFDDVLANTNGVNTYFGTAEFSSVGRNTIRNLAENVAQTIVNQIPTGSFVKLDGNSNPTQNDTFSIGNNGHRYKEIFATTFNGTATAAQYADLAERFEADYKYAPGTLLSLGGTKEVTQTSGAYDYGYFGVVSTNPAYLMNNAEEFQNDMYPPVALAGRVPVRLVGPVRKGQRIALSELQGVARAVDSLQTTDPYFIVGRALVDKADEGEGLVLCVVGAK